MTSSVVFYFTTTLVNLFTTTQTTNPDLPQLQFTTITGMDDVWRVRFLFQKICFFNLFFSLSSI
jgi:hypothetical protein